MGRMRFTALIFDYLEFKFHKELMYNSSTIFNFLKKKKKPVLTTSAYKLEEELTVYA